MAVVAGWVAGHYIDPSSDFNRVREMYRYAIAALLLSRASTEVAMSQATSEGRSLLEAKLTMIALRASLPNQPPNPDRWVVSAKGAMTDNEFLEYLASLKKPIRCEATTDSLSNSIEVRCGPQSSSSEQALLQRAAKEHVRQLRDEFPARQALDLAVTSQHESLIVDVEVYVSWGADYYVAGLAEMFQYPILDLGENVRARLTLKSSRDVRGSLKATPPPGIRKS